ncbi:MAG TPA: hypothetical protein VHE81_03410 [Lacipirellulaceae bacterium]|nr:hypothetical protein [Lacipirellulaceae bacterium]
MKRVPAYVLLLLLLGASVITGQVIYNSASTAAEGYANGMSNVIQSRGQKNLNDSQARINNQDAYSKALDNSTKSVNTFWEQKDIYNQRQQQQFAEIQRQRQAYLAKYGLKSLTPEEFDRASGTVYWPKVLEQPQYNQYRLVIDKLMKDRAYVGCLTSDQYMQATGALKGWREMLSKQQDVYPRPILDQMIRFVLKVNREINDNLS